LFFFIDIYIILIRVFIKFYNPEKRALPFEIILENIDLKTKNYCIFKDNIIYQMRENIYPIVAEFQCPIISIYNLNTNFQFIFKLRADYLSNLQRNSKLNTNNLTN